MANLNPNRAPGIGTEREAAQRRLLLTDASALLLPGGKIIDGSKARDPLNTGDLDVLRPGIVLGKITSGGKYAPSILGVLASAYDKDHSVNKLAMTVSAATAVEINRRIGASGTFNLTGPPTAAGTVATQTITYSAINVTTGVITCSAGSADAIAGSFIQPTDGSQTPLCLIPDGTGIKMTDLDASDLTSVEAPHLLIGGHVDASQIVNWPSDTSLRTWLMGKLNGTDGTMEGSGSFNFDNRY
jgi:hypothetical protein